MKKQVVVFKSKNNDNNGGVPSKKQNVMDSSIENKCKERLAKKAQVKSEQVVTVDYLRNYIISVMAPGTSPAPQFQLTPLPAKYSVANVSIPASQGAEKVTMQSIFKKVSKKK